MSGSTLRLHINGREHQVDEGATVADILARFELRAETVVVEWAGEILPRERYADATPAEGDRLEIVRVVGGG